MRTQTSNYRSYATAAVLRACTLLAKVEVQNVQTSYIPCCVNLHGVEMHNPALCYISEVDGGGRLLYIPFQISTPDSSPTTNVFTSKVDAGIIISILLQ